VTPPTEDPTVEPTVEVRDEARRRTRRPRWVMVTGAGAVVTSLLVGGVLLLRTRGALGGLPPDLHIAVRNRAATSRLVPSPPDDPSDGRGISHVLVRRAPAVRLEEEPDDH
jgi:hypothetical protein